MIYVVTGSGGEFETWTIVCAATKDKSKAEEYVAECNKSNAKLLDIVEKLRKHDDAYRKKYPSPKFPYSKYKTPNLPKRYKEKDLTPELRAHRDAVLAHNGDVSKRWSATVDEWNKEFELVQAKFLEEFELDEEEKRKLISAPEELEAEYQIEEVKEI